MTTFTLDHMDLDTEEARFFGKGDQGTTPPTKRPRPEASPLTFPTTKGKGKGKKGKGKGKGKPTVPPPTWDYASGSESWEKIRGRSRRPASNRTTSGMRTIIYQQHVQNLTRL